MKNLVRGGQISLHSLRMSMQLVFTLSKIFLSSTLFGIIYLIFQEFDLYDLKSLMIFFLAIILNSFFLKDFIFHIKDRSENLLSLRAEQISESQPLIDLKNQFFETIMSAIWLSCLFSIIIVIFALTLFIIKGRKNSKERFIRGGKIVSSYKLKSIILSNNLFKGSFLSKNYHLGGVSYPKDNEFLHTIIMGSTGTGKTSAIFDLIEQIRKNGDRAIIYDKMGSYTSLFYENEKDVILNPLDERSKSWSLFNEVKKDSDFDYLASALIQERKSGGDPFWVESAKKVLAIFARESFQENPEISNEKFVDDLLKSDYKKIAKILAETEAVSIINKDSQKTALSVLAVLSTYISSLKYLHDDQEKFSINDWIRNNDQEGFLFISSKGDQHESLKPLISAWIDIAVKSLLSLKQEKDRRVWIILDEVASLQKLPSLLDGLSQSRQFGGAFLVAIHSNSQLRTIYGKDATDTINSLCRNKLFFAVPDYETAEFCSQNLGLTEVEEIKEAISYGAHQIRDGVNLTPQRQIKKIILPSELMLMERLKAYIKFAGNFPIARLSFFIKDRIRINESFVARELLDSKVPTKRINDEDYQDDDLLDIEINNEETLEKESFNILDE